MSTPTKVAATAIACLLYGAALGYALGISARDTGIQASVREGRMHADAMLRGEMAILNLRHEAGEMESVCRAVEVRLDRQRARLPNETERGRGT